LKPLRKKKLLIKVGAALVFTATISTGITFAGDPNAKEASAEMKWGFKAARRGYWQEALMRFEHANELTPNQPRILNNIAVAQEANGRYEMALLTYQEGLALAPNNSALRRNYTRFQEFYASYIAPPEISDAKGGEDAQKDN
jgi:Flp pilus assembly protein TadD